MAARDAQAATQLVERAKAGDARAFEELVRRYRRRIVALALHLSGSASEAEDIAQDVFLKAYQKLDTFEGRSHFFTWVYRMAVNRSLNKKRDMKRRRESSLEDPRIECAVSIDARDNPHLATELRQTYRRLLSALDSLPPAMRTSVVLVSLQGLSYGEAAVIQECSDGTVAWRIHEARTRLRRALRGPKPPPIPGRGKQSKRSGLSSDLTRLLREWALPLPSHAGA